MTTFAATTETFHYRLEFTDEQATPVSSERLQPADFQRAIAETWFNGFRQGVFASFAPDLEQARVEPLFRPAGPAARTEGFRVVVPRPDGGEFSQTFGVGYMAARAARLQARIRREQHGSSEQSLYYTLAAYLDDAAPVVASRGLISAGATQVHLALGQRGRAEFPAVERWDSPQAADLPVIITRSLLEEAVEEAGRNPEREVGGLMLGHLHRDPEQGELFLEVTCLVSGEGTTSATAVSVTFTPECFARARSMLQLRDPTGTNAELIVGWYHSHPFRFCQECPLPAPPECLQKVLFYSADDLNVMESVFSQPFHVGLLAAIEPRIAPTIGHLPVKLFGWRNGETVARGFEVTVD